MRTGLRIVAALGIVLPAGTARAASPARPNVVFVLADDLGYGDLGVYGQNLIRTPNLDRLAAEGIRFTDFYAGSTVCAPSRAVLMTGRHTGHASVRGNAGGGALSIQALRPGERTLAHLFRDAGYATALFGKWGLGEIGSPGHPSRMGFDAFFGYLNQRHAHNYYPSFLFRDEARVATAQRAGAGGRGGRGLGPHARRVLARPDRGRGPALGRREPREALLPLPGGSRSPTPTTRRRPGRATDRRSPTTAATRRSPGRARTRARPR